MALSISRSEAQKLMKQAESARSRLKRARERANETVERVVQTSEVGFSAFSFGLINGRWGGVELMGVPVDLASAGALHVLGLAGVAPDHMHNFADGALASFATTLGAGVGQDLAREAGPQGTAAGAVSRSRLADLARL